MKIPAFISIVVVAFTAVGNPNAAAQTASSDVLTYKLEKTSRFETGCFSMCECPIVTHPIQGTFHLRQTGFDPLFTYYEISDVSWVVSNPNTYLTLRGSGTYRVGGEFALQHQLTLDLSIEGEPSRHFDSGLLLGGGEFPRILIDVSLHQDTACVDTVIHVDATDPVATSVDAGSTLSTPWLRVGPNPFRGQTGFHLAVPHAASVEAIIYDARGRAVRHLRRSWLTPGVHQLGWDGLRDQGSPCPAGVYFLKARIGAERMTRRIVKLD